MDKRFLAAFILVVFVVNSCTTKHNRKNQRNMTVMQNELSCYFEVRDSSDSWFVRVPQKRLGMDEYGITRQKYFYVGDTLYLEGFIISSRDLPSFKEGSIWGVSGFEIYLCEWISIGCLKKIKLLGVSDCAGKLKIYFKPEKNKFLVIKNTSIEWSGASCTEEVYTWIPHEAKENIYMEEIKCE